MSSALRITTHILDTSNGVPASNVPVKLFKLKDNDTWSFITEGSVISTSRQNYKLKSLIYLRKI